MFGQQNHGTAAWASPRDLQDAGLFDFTTGRAAYLGQDPQTGKDLAYSGDSHILTIAPPGTGKTAGVVIPSLLTDQSSMVVTDTKGALTSMTAGFRRDVLGQKVVILNPWADEIAKDTGESLGDTGFNPLSLIRAGDPAVIDNAELLGKLLCPTPPDSKDTYWTDTGADILTGLLLFFAHQDAGQLTLGNLYKTVRQDRKGWFELSEAMRDCKAIDLESYAATIRSPLESPKQWSGLEGALHKATAIYNPLKSLAQHVAKDGFDPASLKREKVTLYLVIPSNRRDANKAWLALVLGLCAEAIGRAGKSSPVTLLAEEFANLGYMPTIHRAMAEYREAGLRAHLIIQTPHQLREVYGEKGGRLIEDLCGVKQFFGVDDLDVAQKIERMCGTYTQENDSTSISPNGWSNSTSHMAVPLIRAQDVLKLPKDHQIILLRGPCPPILAYVRPYYTRGEMLPHLGKNPFRESQPAALPFDPVRAPHDERIFAAPTKIPPEVWGEVWRMALAWAITTLSFLWLQKVGFFPEKMELINVGGLVVAFGGVMFLVKMGLDWLAAPSVPRKPRAKAPELPRAPKARVKPNPPKPAQWGGMVTIAGQPPRLS